MAQVVGYEIEVQVDGAWRTVQSFGPSEHGSARMELARLETRPPGGGLKLVEETVDDGGVFKRRTLVFKRLGDPSAAARTAKKVPAPAGKAERRSERRLAAAAKARRSGFGGSLTDLLSFLFIPARARTIDGPDGSSTVSAPPVAVPTEMRGDVPVFEDEKAKPQDELVVIDATYRQFHTFFEALENSGMVREARRDPEFSRRISLFAIGVLFSIEQDIDIFSERGKAMVSAVLKFFIESHEEVGHFVQTMERYLTAEDAPAAIRIGSRCFKAYQDVDMDGVKREFESAFGTVDELEEGLGGRVKVGILFTDIVDSTRMTTDLGDEKAQRVIDHHEEVVLGVCRRFGGRKVKHLGDGLMLSFASKEKMVACAVAVVDAMKGTARRSEIPDYQIRCGGHFGEAIRKEDDFFGGTVQLAARISAKAGSNQACFSTLLFDRALPTYELFENRGAQELKGIGQPVSLAVYR